MLTGFSNLVQQQELMDMLYWRKSTQEVADGRINTSLAYYCNKLVLPCDKSACKWQFRPLGPSDTLVVRKKGVDFTYY